MYRVLNRGRTESMRQKNEAVVADVSSRVGNVRSAKGS